MDLGSDTILVTGGAGYIGSHVVHALRDSSRNVVVIDNLVTGNRAAVPIGTPLYEFDAGDTEAVRKVLRDHQVGAIMHFAGSVIVPESVENPIKYYRNNTVVSASLVEAAVAERVAHFVFSSTAAVYGASERAVVDEGAPKAPISPYGWSKLMTEVLLEDVAAAYPWFRPVRLRYFNVAGADPKGRTGQQGPESTHLIRVAIETALGQREKLQIFGNDYDTRDGSCERDYIHVWDLAQAHLAALRHIEKGQEGGVFNCGYGRGVTVKEVVAALETLTGEVLPVESVGRRAGDPARLIADPTCLIQTMQWIPEYTDIHDIIGSALRWQQFLGKGKSAGQ